MMPLCSLKDEEETKASFPSGHGAKCKVHSPGLQLPLVTGGGRVSNPCCHCSSVTTVADGWAGLNEKKEKENPLLLLCLI